MRVVLAVALSIAANAWAQPCRPPACTDGAIADDGVSILNRVGRVKAPFATADLPRVESEFTAARMLVATGHYRIAERWSVGLRIPTAPSSVRQPSGSYVAENIFGNIELFAEHQLELWRRGRMRLRPALRVGLAAPTAGLGSVSEVTENRGLAISNALDGWRLPELYEPGVVPVTFSARIDGELDQVRVLARAKLPWLVRISDGGYPDDAVTRPLGIVPIFELAASYWPWSWMGVGAGSFLVINAPAPVAPGSGSDRAGRVQLGVEPSLRLVIANHVMLEADLALPVGGPLEDTLGIGLTISAYR
ncbi:MAG: hypothetical protein KJO07_04440 [Deltaproteobacteria bacterium]|nr:hypothetical protein [Deltaproteobacteria bacterium]